MIERAIPIPSVSMDPIARTKTINPMRKFVRSWVQGTDRASQISIVGATTAQDTITAQKEFGLTGDFEITHFTSDHRGPYRLTIYVGGGTNYALSAVPIHVDNCIGTAERPLYLPVSIFLNSGAILNITFQNLTASTTNKIRLKAHGRRFLNYDAFMAQQAISDQFYGRGTLPYFAGLNDTSVTLGANSTNTSSYIQIPSHADLEAEYLVGKTQAPARLQILETKSSPPIMSGGGTGANIEVGVETSHVLGTARDPYRFTPDGAYFTRTALVQTLWDELSNTANTVEIALIGRLLFFPQNRRPPTGAPRVVAA